jgi:hypothetical protein
VPEKDADLIQYFGAATVSIFEQPFQEIYPKSTNEILKSCHLIIFILIS